MSADRTCTATFDPPTFTVTVTVVDNTGTETVTGSGIDCPGDCTEVYVEDTPVQLTANPDAGRSFVWSGDCDASRNVTMDGIIR